MLWLTDDSLPKSTTLLAEQLTSLAGTILPRDAFCIESMYDAAEWLTGEGGGVSGMFDEVWRRSDCVLLSIPNACDWHYDGKTGRWIDRTTTTRHDRQFIVYLDGRIDEWTDPYDPPVAIADASTVVGIAQFVRLICGRVSHQTNRTSVRQLSAADAVKRVFARFPKALDDFDLDFDALPWRHHRGLIKLLRGHRDHGEAWLVGLRHDLLVRRLAKTAELLDDGSVSVTDPNSFALLTEATQPSNPAARQALKSDTLALLNTNSGWHEASARDSAVTLPYLAALAESDSGATHDVVLRLELHEHILPEFLHHKVSPDLHSTFHAALDATLWTNTQTTSSSQFQFPSFKAQVLSSFEIRATQRYIRELSAGLQSAAQQQRILRHKEGAHKLPIGHLEQARFVRQSALMLSSFLGSPDTTMSRVQDAVHPLPHPIAHALSLVTRAAANDDADHCIIGITALLRSVALFAAAEFRSTQPNPTSVAREPLPVNCMIKKPKPTMGDWLESVLAFSDYLGKLPATHVFVQAVIAHSTQVRSLIEQRNRRAHSTVELTEDATVEFCRSYSSVARQLAHGFRNGITPQMLVCTRRNQLRDKGGFRVELTCRALMSSDIGFETITVPVAHEEAHRIADGDPFIICDLLPTRVVALHPYFMTKTFNGDLSVYAYDRASQHRGLGVFTPVGAGAAVDYPIQPCDLE
jgi:hypothetical protein